MLCLYFVLGLVSGFRAMDYEIMSRIYDGKQLRYDVHKYLVALEASYTKYYTKSWCSGSIVHKSWILTSAHCVDNSFIADIDVLHYMGHKNTLSLIQKANLRKIFMHPSYDKYMSEEIEMRSFDIALVKTKGEIHFNKYVSPIKLSERDPVGESAVIAAYGVAEYKEKGHKEGVVTVEDCEWDDPGVLCSTSLVRAGSGDSGGALVSRGKLVGVISASCRDVEIRENCLTIYTSVGPNKDWIKSVMFSE